jgi:hypothetical protein
MKTLSVVPNPHAAHDAEGTPCATVMVEGVADQYVGARVDVEATRTAGKMRFVIGDEPVRVPLTAYYLRRLQDGSLLAADEDTWRWSRAQGEFELPEQVLARLRAGF